MGADMTKMEADVRVGGSYSVHHLQPPLGLPRRGDAGYSASAEIGRCRLLRFGRDWEMEGTPLRQRLGDAGYSASAEIERCRNRCSATDSHDRKGKPKVTKQQQKKTG